MVLRVRSAAEGISSIIIEAWILSQVTAAGVHMLAPQDANTREARENGHAAAKSVRSSRPFVWYRVSDCRSLFAPLVLPDLVGYGAVSVNHLLYTLKERSRRCVNVPPVAPIGLGHQLEFRRNQLAKKATIGYSYQRMRIVKRLIERRSVMMSSPSTTSVLMSRRSFRAGVRRIAGHPVSKIDAVILILKASYFILFQFRVRLNPD